MRPTFSPIPPVPVRQCRPFRSSPSAPLRLLAVVALFLLATPAAAQAPAPHPLQGDPVEWLAEYLRIDTTNPPGNEVAGVRFLARLLHRHGIATRTFFTAGGRASLYARLEGRSDDGALLLLHHVDVVAAGEGWQQEPFGGEEVEGELWGRGAIDVKSLGIAHLTAFLELAAAGEPPERDVIFLAVADEESGGTLGTAWLLESHPEIVEGVGGVLGEGGSNKVVNGRLLWWGVERAQKQPLWLEVTATGRPGHASGLNVTNANHALIDGMARALERPREWKVTQPVREYLAALAPLHNDADARRFRDPDAWVGPEGPRGPMMPGQANLFLDGFQVTELQAGERINVVPPTATARIDARLLPETDADAWLAELRDILGPRLQVEVLLASPPAPPSPLDSRLFRALVEVLGDEGPVVPSFISGFTDSRYFRARGIPTYGFSPFLLEPQHLLTIHGPDERIPVEVLRDGIERTVEVVRRYATSP